MHAELARIKESNKRAEKVLGNPINWSEPKRQKALREKRIEEVKKRLGPDHPRVQEAIHGRKDTGL